LGETPLLKQPPSGLIQRKCVCGGGKGIGDQCEGCAGKALSLQRSALSSNEPLKAPPIAGELLGSDQPRHAAMPTFMEPQLGHHFSQIHTYTRAIRPVQTKLAVNKPGDEYEQEADRIADQVLAAPAHDSVGGAPPRIQRFAAQPVGQTDIAPASVDGVLAGSGRPLDPALQLDMERRFGYDFSQVRVHSGAAAEQSAQDINASAYTVGHDIVFDTGRFQPSSYAGRRLIAHELGHVIQQTGAEQGRVDQRDEKVGLAAPYDLKHILRQEKGNRHLVSRKCDVDPALDYYEKTPQGKKIDFKEWLENMRKVAGIADKSLYGDAKASGKIDRSFVLLVCKVQEILNVREDGKLGPSTAAAFDKFATGGEKGIDYTKLFKDKKLEVGIAIGHGFFEDEPKKKSEFNSIVALLETAGKELKNFSSTGSKGTRLIKFTKEFPVQGDKTAPPVAIDVEFNIVSEESATPKKTYSEFLSKDEIVIYSGHAREGTGPDFDAVESVKENFIIGVNSVLHKAGKLTRGYDEHMNKILEGYGNDLEAMSKAGKIDPDKYQVWFFNACRSIDYLDEIRRGLVTDKTGKIKSKANLRFVGTKFTIYSDAAKIVEGILNMQSMDEIIRIMDVNEKAEVKKRREEVKSGYYFSD
jgi:hypothetical protein